MKKQTIAWFLGMAMLAGPALALAQSTPLLLPPQLEKDLEAKASNVNEVTLDKSMLGFASKFMDNKNKNQAAVKGLIDGLDGIYVRDFTFDHEGAYSMDDVEKVRQAFATPEWSSLVHTREAKGKETNEVMVKLVNGEARGMLVISAEPRELSIVLILGPIHMDQLGALQGISGLGSLGDIDKSTKGADKTAGPPKKGSNE